MSDKKMITIFNQRLCGYLQMKGFVLVGMAENKHCAGKNVFFFNDTEELSKALMYMKCVEKAIESEDEWLFKRNEVAINWFIKNRAM